MEVRRAKQLQIGYLICILAVASLKYVLVKTIIESRAEAPVVNISRSIKSQYASEQKVMAPSIQNLKAFYRSYLFQIIVVGLVSLCEPGIWMALNSLGAGGQASVRMECRFPGFFCLSETVLSIKVLLLGYYAASTPQNVIYTRICYRLVLPNPARPEQCREYLDLRAHVDRMHHRWWRRQ